MNIGTADIMNVIHSEIYQSTLTSKYSVYFVLKASNQKGVGLGHLSRANIYASWVNKFFNRTHLVLIQEDKTEPPTALSKNFDTIIIAKSISSLLNTNDLNNLWFWDLPPASLSNFPRPLGKHFWISDSNQAPKSKFDAWILPWPKKPEKCSSLTLSGPEWMALEKLPSYNRKNRPITSIAVTFGGSDPKDFSSDIYKLWTQIQSDYHLNIFLGPAYQGKLLIPKPLHETPQVEIKHNVDNLYAELAKSDFVLCCGGITPWALAKMEIPFSIIPSIEHEVENAQTMESFLNKQLILPQPKHLTFIKKLKTALKQQSLKSDTIKKYKELK
jgi:hypothetical protein